MSVLRKAKPVLGEDTRSIRHTILQMSMRAKSAHVGSALSCVEIVYTLFKQRYQEKTLDRMILSKGHAAMVLYAVAHHFGRVPQSDIDNYLKDGTRLWGHPSAVSSSDIVDWSTGSLGHGLAVATGFAYSRKFIFGSNQRVAVVISDGECNEGTIWEAALFAGHHGLDNLTVIVDYNKIQSFGRVEDVINLEPFVQKWRSFGWNTIEGDGHDLSFLENALSQKSVQSGRPTCIIAHTVKGKGVPDIENTLESHYKPISAEQLERFKREK